MHHDHLPDEDRTSGPDRLTTPHLAESRWPEILMPGNEMVSSEPDRVLKEGITHNLTTFGRINSRYRNIIGIVSTGVSVNAFLAMRNSITNTSSMVDAVFTAVGLGVGIGILLLGPAEHLTKRADDKYRWR